MNTKVLFASIAVAAAAVTSSADTIAYWNFNTLSIATAGTPAALGLTSIAATTGSATVSLTNWLGNIDDFTGSTIGALNSDAAEESLSLIAGGTAAPFPGNGSSIDIILSTTGFEDISIAFATRGTASGFDTGSWSYSTDGSSFTAVAGVNTATRTTTFAATSVDLTSLSDIDNAASVILRYTLSGATNSSGNNRIDNLVISGTAVIPEPSTYAAIAGVLGLGAAVVARRRRS